MIRINKTNAFRLAHKLAWLTSEEGELRAKLHHAADMQSHSYPAAAGLFVDEHFEEFFEEHLAWPEIGLSAQ